MRKLFNKRSRRKLEGISHTKGNDKNSLQKVKKTHEGGNDFSCNGNEKTSQQKLKKNLEGVSHTKGNEIFFQ